MWIITDKGILKNDLTQNMLTLVDGHAFKNPQIKKSPDGSLWIKEGKQIFHLSNDEQVKAFDIDLDVWGSNFNVDTYGKLWVVKDGNAYYLNNENKLVEYKNVDKYKNSAINGKKVKQYEPQAEDYSKIVNVFFDLDGSKWFSIEVNTMGIFSEYKLINLKNDGQVKEYGPFQQRIYSIIPINKDKKIVYAYDRVMTMSSWMVYSELDTTTNKLSILVNDANGDASEGAPSISELYSDDKGNAYFRKRDVPDDQLLYLIKPNKGLVRYFLQDNGFGEAKYVDNQENVYVVKDKSLYVIAPLSPSNILGKANKSSTDAFIDGKYIKSYNVLGQLAFSLKDLTNFGFKINYDKQKKLYSFTKAINNTAVPKVFPYSSEYYKKQKEKAKGFANLEGKDICFTDSLGSSEYDAHFQIYMVGNEPVVFAKNIIKFNYNENNNRFEVYYNGLSMQDGYYNNEPLSSLIIDNDYIYCISPKEGFMVLNKNNPSKATRFDSYSNKSIMSDKAHFVAKAANGTILVFNEKGIFTFKPDVKGYFTRIAPYLTLDSVKKVKKLYPKLDSKTIYYPDKLRNLYEKDIAKFYKEMMNNQDKINGIYQDNNSVVLINSGGYKFNPISKKKELVYTSMGSYEMALPNGYMYLAVRYIKIDLNILNKSQKVELFTGEDKPKYLNWQIISKEKAKDGSLVFTVLNENKAKILLIKSPKGIIKFSK